MAQTARFFSAKRTKGGFILSLRGQQVASIYRDGKSFWAVCCRKDQIAYDFTSFEAAELWVWNNYA